MVVILRLFSGVISGNDLLRHFSSRYSLKVWSVTYLDKLVVPQCAEEGPGPANS
jgi:hypothetical protein